MAKSLIPLEGDISQEQAQHAIWALTHRAQLIPLPGSAGCTSPFDLPSDDAGPGQLWGWVYSMALSAGLPGRIGVYRYDETDGINVEPHPHGVVEWTTEHSRFRMFLVQEPLGDSSSCDSFNLNKAVGDLEDYQNGLAANA